MSKKTMIIVGILAVIVVAVVVVFATSSEQFQGRFFFKSKNTMEPPKVYSAEPAVIRKTPYTPEAKSKK